MRSHDKEAGKAAIHMVSAWATQNRLVLGQVKVDAKSNEITAIPELLRRLDIRGCLISVDAMGCQVDIAELIVAQGADYLFSPKGNQSHRHEDVVLLFDDLETSGYLVYPHDVAKTVDKGHGRIEVRHGWTISDPQLILRLRGAERFHNLQTVVRIRANAILMTITRLKTVTLSAVQRRKPPWPCMLPVYTGKSRTRFIGCSISPFGKMRPASARAMVHRTSPSYVTLRSMLSNRRRLPKLGSRTSGSKRAGMSAISFLSLAIFPFDAIALRSADKA